MRVLYTGPGLAGVRTSVHVLAREMNVTTPEWHRVGFTTNELDVWSDVRTPSWLGGCLETALETCARNLDDPRLAHLCPLFDAHAAHLTHIDGVVFVADSQIERREANLESRDRLDRDLRFVGRDPSDVRVVFACNKQDLPRARRPEQLAPELFWPRAVHVGTSALTGAGVVEAFEALRRNQNETTSGPSQPPV
jgi:hypothetical protein